MFSNVVPNERLSPQVPLQQEANVPIDQYLGGGQIPTEEDGTVSKLIIKQFPILGRALGKEKDRKALDPPPVIQLLDRRPNIHDSPYLFMICSLLSKDKDFLTSSVECPPNYLVGSRTSSVYHLKDSNGVYGGFFIFGDLSIRHEGTFRLRFTLYDRVEDMGDPSFYFVSEIISEPLTICSPKKFPGMAESTPLTRIFCEQGVKLRLRKDGRTSNVKKRSQNIAEATAPFRDQASKRIAYDRGGSFDTFGQGMNPMSIRDRETAQDLRARSMPLAMQEQPSIPNTSALLASASFDPINYTHTFDHTLVPPVQEDVALAMPYPMLFTDTGGAEDGNLLGHVPGMHRHPSQRYMGEGYGMAPGLVRDRSSGLPFESGQREPGVEPGDAHRVAGHQTPELGGGMYRQSFPYRNSYNNTQIDMP